MRYMEAIDGDEGGAAGDTGSAVHKAAELFHDGASVSESLSGMHDKLAEYPRAVLAEAAQMFLAYASDTRNSTAKLVLNEQPIRFSIEASPHDPTGAPIEVIGRLDQVREDEWGQLKAYDIKTSKKDPQYVRSISFFQMAAYCVGATVKLGRPVNPGAIIMPRKYGAHPSTSNVFFPYTYKLHDCELILEGLRNRIAEIRMGYVTHVPNDDCMWCKFQQPDLCLPELTKFRKSLPVVAQS